MRAPVRLLAFGAGLVAVFGAAAAVGAAAGPIDVGGDGHDAEHDADPPTPTDGHADDHGATTSPDSHAGGHATSGSSAATVPADAGEAVRIVADATSAAAGEPIHYTFTIEGPDGPVVAFDEAHERRLHLIVVSDDLVDFWHLHPEMTPDGTWHIELPALEARVYTIYADVVPTGGEQVTLRSRLVVTAGSSPAASPRPLPDAVATDDVDGFEVHLSGTPAVGDATFRFDVRRDGASVTTEPYLGALGHLVAIRVSDQDYLHVHPLDGGGPQVRFAAALPSAGTYRLFLDFSVDGVVRTASFTVEVPTSGGGTTAPAEGHEEHG